jgi:uncharacterized protein
VHAELEALLRLQDADDAVEEILARLDGIAPRIAALDAERARVARQLEQAEGQLAAAERKERDVAQRVAEHRQRHERNVAQFDLVKRLREAEAAQSQVEAGKRMLQEGEHDLAAIGETVTGIRRSVEAHQASLAAFDATQEERRSALTSEQRQHETQLAAARGRREEAAAHVPGTMRTPYERIRARRRARVVYPIHSGACSACDTSVPVQRRAQMQGKGSLESCEGCGMLLYAVD